MKYDKEWLGRQSRRIKAETDSWPEWAKSSSEVKPMEVPMPEPMKYEDAEKEVTRMMHWYRREARGLEGGGAETCKRKQEALRLVLERARGNTFTKDDLGYLSLAVFRMPPDEIHGFTEGTKQRVADRVDAALELAPAQTVQGGGGE